MGGTDLIGARLRGAFVPEVVSGRVLSRHAKALNINDEGCGLLVSLLLDEADMTGMGVVVATLPDGLAPGDAVRATWTAAPAWDGRLPAGKALRRRLIEWLAEALRTNGVAGGFLPLLVAWDANPFGLRARGLLSTSAAPLAALVGLGPGFTPSGDDFLTGALLAESWLGPQGDVLDRGSLRAALGRTTPGGRTLLSLALQGSYPAYLLRFVEQARAASGRREVEAAVRQAVDHGETSGTDALLGLLWGLGGLERET